MTGCYSIRYFSLIVIFFLVSASVALSDNTASSDDYVIGDGDGLSIHVWGEAQLSQSAQVRPDGKITLPGIGDIYVSGYTPMNLSKKLTEDLKKIVKNPIVTVTVSGITNSKIYVFGGGPGTGVHPLPGRITLLKFLIGMGDLSATADLENAYLIRNNQVIFRNFYPLFMEADFSKDIQIQAGDFIYLPNNELNKIYVMGAVGGPTAMPYRKTMRILDVILGAGGFNQFAKENDVLVLRKEKGSDQAKEIELKIEDLMEEGDFSQNILMMPGDFVIVKEGIF
jgi:polysaccharide export outer membrane protein